MLLRLDISLLCKIFNFLDLESLLKLSLVNKLFYNLAKQNINSKGDAYRKYQETTSSFIPLPSKKIS